MSVMSQVTCTQSPQHRQAFSMGTNAPPTGLSTAPVIEMVPNPDFHLPREAPPTNDFQTASEDWVRRSHSLQIPGGMASSPRSAHRRAVSTLPTFSFNASNVSGLQDSSSPPAPLTPDEPTHVTTATTPRRGHRRGGSEFVGGDSRLGLDNTISTSPAKTSILPIPAPVSGPPPGRRGHAHRRSAAMSSHDVSNIMQAPDSSPRLSSSLPNSPLEHPAQGTTRFTLPEPTNINVIPMPDPFVVDMNILSDVTARPRVEFADIVEYIPRPLSTISSGTEESMSTHRNHSVNTSISSMLSLGTPSPVTRSLRPSLSTTFENESKGSSSNFPSTFRNEREGDWLKANTGNDTLTRPVSEPCALPPALSFDPPESPIKARAHGDAHRKRQSLSHTLGFHRRRSEPMISAKAQDHTRLSSISLPGAPPYVEFGEDADDEFDRDVNDRPSSRHRLKSWAKGKFTRKGRETRKSYSFDTDGSPVLRPATAGELANPPLLRFQDTAEAETDLDAVFSSQAEDDATHAGMSSQARIEMLTPSPSHHGSLNSTTPDELSPMLDLDAALGPFKTPPLGSHRARRDLHSSRMNKDFGGFGNLYHRRTESAPVLPLFESPLRNAVQSTMADVFEEEEEDDAFRHKKPTSVKSDPDSLTNVATSASEGYVSWTLDNGLRISTADDTASNDTSGHHTAQHSNAGERRSSVLISETILEESSSMEAVEIVHPEEEPRSSSLTKSSDSSEAPTLLGPASGEVRPQLEPPTIFTFPEASSTSSMSSPDWARRQSSFDTSRLGTSASSIADNRTVSSYGPDFRASVDDVPSLTSSRSTMLSTRRDFSGEATLADPNALVEEDAQTERRRKRASIQSLSQLVGSPFGPKSKAYDGPRPQTAVETASKASKKKEHRLKKLLFWKNKTINSDSRSHG